MARRNRVLSRLRLNVRFTHESEHRDAMVWRPRKGDVKFLSLAERFLPSIVKSIDLPIEGASLFRFESTMEDCDESL